MGVFRISFLVLYGFVWFVLCIYYFVALLAVAYYHWATWAMPPFELRKKFHIWPM